MSWEIKHRISGNVILKGDGNLSYANLRGANLRGANLRGAYLGGADLGGADLSEADLVWANLSGAYLRGADLSEADLHGANLRGTYLRGTCVIDIGQRSDGFQFYLQLREDDEPLVLAGCRYFRLSKAREHWAKTRGGSQLGDESQALLDHGERLASIRRAAQ
jgi:uncharacterized protein YjbI with pentapeptide repeats